MKAYGFRKSTAQHLANLVRRDRQTGISSPAATMQGTKNSLPSVALWAAKCQAEISARSGTTAGSGTARLIELDGTTLTEYTNNAGSTQDLTVYNYTDSVISVGEYFTVTRDYRGTLWVVKAGEGGSGDPTAYMGVVTEVGGIAGWNGADGYSSGRVVAYEHDTGGKDIDSDASTILFEEVRNLEVFDLEEQTPVRIWKGTDDTGAEEWVCRREVPGDRSVGTSQDLGRPVCRLRATGNTGVGAVLTPVDGWSVIGNNYDYASISSGTGTNDVVTVPTTLYQMPFVVTYDGSNAGDVFRLTAGGVTGVTDSNQMSFSSWETRSYLHVHTASTQLSYSGVLYNNGNSNTSTNKTLSFNFTVQRISGSGTVDIDDIFLMLDPVHF